MVDGYIEEKGRNLAVPTLKGLTLGIVFTFLISISEPYIYFVLHANRFCQDYASAGALAFLFLSLIIIGAFRKVNRRFNIPKQDLITIYTMLIVASPIASVGPMYNLYSMTAGVIYYATPENRWAEIMHPYLKDWVVPTDPEAARILFEGRSEGKILWDVWGKPLFSWGMFILAFYLVMVFMMVILRKQWVEREKLLFPIARLPIEMMRTDDRGRMTFLRSRLMWVGFAIAFLFVWLRGLHFHYPFIPYLDMSHDYFLFRRTTHVIVSLNFFVLGFAYLLPLDVSLSMWLFYILLRAETVVFRVLGYDIQGRALLASSSFATTLQNGGALIVLVLFGLWLARGHLKEVFKKAFTGHSEIDDSDELVSYRTAVFGMIFGLAFIALWLKMAGLPWIVLPVVIGAIFLITLGLTKIVAQAGVGVMCTGVLSLHLATSSIGTEAFGTQGIVSLGPFWRFQAGLRSSVMASTANALKLSDEGKLSKRSLLLPVILAIVIPLVFTSLVILKFVYVQGGINMPNFTSTPMINWDIEVYYKLFNPTTLGMVLQRWLFICVGGGVMFFLMFMGTRFLWWPLHYIGFPIADTWAMSHIWFTVFVAWLIKMTVLEYWGVRGYRALMPLLLGFVLGQICGAGVWIIVDIATGTVGNFIPVGPG